MTDPALAPPRVVATPAALAFLAELTATHGPVLFHQSGGCCDGSTPMCWPRSDFVIGDGDVRLGEIGEAPFHMARGQFDYWKHTQLIIDVVPGMGGMFSLDNGSGRRFLTRSRLFTDGEVAALAAAEQAGAAPAAR
ncbi:DUF779 domain-containing protein [Siculibacillus lacustris]|uniref:DUF779 domain-containing protein n=1 Tax=Siculibacillus lacustris TaxID=1549641 RepID=A0A4Q9VMC6_9HYPH|nr:DUF779 domain-containing protein [Siculibacillus lacustris]TBW36462.1 DUF779 domain-containing protein [Siculibacillus lacustris]